ncbi:MAG: sigma-70 family RNA polymerase sigma factor [Betaproteobacteria bacterium]|nr:sigma-70 family RNA polymerase sigma factor [Betaproteobacteria bacterium]
MLAYAAGDVSAFERLYTRHARAVHRFIARLLRSDAAADDLLQDTWFAVARNAATYQPSARFTTWLYTIARSRVIDHVRAQRPSVSLDEPAGAGDEAPTLGEQLAADARDEPLRRLEGREDARTFLRALDALPDAQREAFLLQAEGDLSVEAIAQATGVGVETARSRLRYARARLRAHLAAAAANGVAR